MRSEATPYSPYQLTDEERLQVDLVFTGNLARDVTSKHALSKSDFLKRLENADLILLGETHDNRTHHLLEIMITQHLITTDWLKQLSLEMLTPQQKANANQIYHLNHNQALPYNLTLDELKTAFLWSDYGWPWEDYYQVLAAAQTHAIPIEPANINKQQIMSIYQGADTSVALKPNATQTAALIDSIVDSHCGQIDKKQAVPMVNIQLAKDQAMANSLSKKTTGALLIAGAFHVRKDLSVPLHLQSTNSSKNILVIGMVEKTDEEMTEDFSSRYDIVIFTQPQKRDDPCDVFNK